MRNTKVKAIAEGAVAAALCTLLNIISMYVPVLSLFSTFLCGYPLMLIFCRWGAVVGFTSMVCSYAVTFIMTGSFLSPLLLMFLYALPTAMFGLMVNKKQKFSNAVFVTALFVLIGFVTQLMLLNGEGSGIEAQFSAMSEEMGNSLGMIFSQNPALENADIKNLISEAITMTVNTLMLYLPAISIIFSAVLGYIISAFSVFLLKRLKIKNVSYVSFNRIKAPTGTIVIFILSFLLIHAYDNGGLVISAIKNLSVIATAAVALSGFSFVDYMLSQKIKSGYIRAEMYIAVGFVGFMMISIILELFILFGIFDSLNKKRVPDETGDDKLEKE